MPNFTIAGLAEQVINVFTAFGFKANNAVAKLETDHRGKPTGSIVISFDEQEATGQAAFTQDKIKISASIYLGEEIEARPDLKPWQIWAIDTMAILDPDVRAGVMEHGALVTLDVAYTHHDGGSNGKGVRFCFKNGMLRREQR